MIRAQSFGAGIGLGLVAFVGNVLGFFATLLGCRAENQVRYPAACPPLDGHPELFFWLAVVGTALLLPYLAAIGVRVKPMVLIGAAVWLAWLVYFVVVAAT